MKMYVLSTSRSRIGNDKPQLIHAKVFMMPRRDSKTYFLTLAVLHCYFSDVSINKHYLLLAIQSALLQVLLGEELVPVLETFIL